VNYCIGDYPYDETRANERISVALEVLLQRAVGVAQGSAAVVDAGPDAPASGASAVSKGKIQTKLSSAPNPNGASCRNQVVARHAPSPMTPSKRQRLDMVPHICRIIKQPDTSWIRSDWQPPLLHCGAEQVPPAAQGAGSRRLVRRVGSYASSTFADPRSFVKHDGTNVMLVSVYAASSPSLGTSLQHAESVAVSTASVCNRHLYFL